MVGTDYQYYIFNEDEVSAAFDYFVKNPDIVAGFLSRRTDGEGSMVISIHEEEQY